MDLAGSPRAGSARVLLERWRQHARRTLHDWLAPAIPRHARQEPHIHWPTLVQVSRALWTDGRADSYDAEVGRVHNLRVAAAALNGRVTPAGATFSFWRQIGPLRASTGYVTGTPDPGTDTAPVLGGGVGLLADALAECVQRAGFQFLERHITAVTSGHEPAGHPVQVAWKHQDLRFLADVDLQIVAELTSDHLQVCLLCPDRLAPLSWPAPHARVTAQPLAPPAAREVVVVLEHVTPEVAGYLAQHHPQARLLLPGRSRGLPGRAQSTRQSALQALARQLRPEHTHLVLAHDLACDARSLGLLGGRTYEVLLEGMPHRERQQALDEAAALWPNDTTLRSGRRSEAALRIEQVVLKGARRLVTAHRAAAAALHGNGSPPVLLLDWVVPAVRRPPRRGDRAAPTLVFAGPFTGARGAHAFCAAMQGLSCRVLVLGALHEARQGLSFCQVRQGDAEAPLEWLGEADLLVLPAHVESAPRALRLALTHGIPVVATAACGLPANPALRLVPAGDVAALRAALLALVPALRG